MDMCQLDDPNVSSQRKGNGCSLLGFGNIQSVQGIVHFKAHRYILIHFLYEEGEAGPSARH